MRQTGLTELEAVLAVARRGNFRQAAAELGMSASALSHAVASLEGRLGARLFNRTTRSVSLSAAGEEFVAQVAPALREIRGAMQAVDSHRATPAGPLRINTSGTAARRILTPVILEYLRRYPKMTVDLVTEGRLIDAPPDIVAKGFDAGIRARELVPRDMIVVPLGPALGYAVVGAPSYFEVNPPPQTPADLMSHRCIRLRMTSGAIYRWEFARQGKEVNVDVTGPLTLDDPALILEAAKAGVGLAYLWEWYVTEDLSNGRLVRVLQDWTPLFPGLCLYYPGRRHVPAGLRALIDLIRETEIPSAAHRRR